jgi:hypothetical protein
VLGRSETNPAFSYHVGSQDCRKLAIDARFSHEHFRQRGIPAQRTMPIFGVQSYSVSCGPERPPDIRTFFLFF